jgi:competence protein ComEC
VKNQPALKTALFFAGGIFLGRSLAVPFHVLIAVLFLLFALSSAFFFVSKQFRMVQATAALVLLFSGWLRYRQACDLLPDDHIVRTLPRKEWVELKAFLVKDPVHKKGRIELLVEAEAMRMPDASKTDAPEIDALESSTDSSWYSSVRGKVMVPFYGADSCRLGYGDEVVLRGKLERPRPRSNPGAFDYRAFLARNGILVILKPFDDPLDVRKTGAVRGNAFMRNAVYPVRRSILKTVSRTCDAETEPVLKALLVGDQGGISDDVREGFSRSGAVHILSVSGSHVGFVLLILTTMFGMFRFSQPFRTVFTLAGLFLYCLVAEANPPVVRATLMAAVYVFGMLFEKKSDPFNVIGVSAMVCLVAAPQDLFDVGFQLSYASVLSIVFFYQRLNAIAWIKRAGRVLGPGAAGRFILSAALVSVAAQIGTLPLIALYFNQIPLLSVFANLAAVPLSGLIVALGFTTCFAAPVSSGAAAAYGALNRTLLRVFIRSLVWLGNRPFSHWVVPSPNPFHLAFFAAFLCFIVRFHHRRIREAAVGIMVISAVACAWKPVLEGKHKTFTWIQFDVGQGDAALLRFPGDGTILVDGGARTPTWDAGERVIVPYLRREGIRRLDAVVLTHPHDDHAGGLISVLDHFRVGKIIVNGDSFDSPLYSEWARTVMRKRIPVDTVLASESLTCFKGAKVTFMTPGRNRLWGGANDRSLVTRVSFGNRAFLLMGDAGNRAEALLMASGVPLQSDVIKIGHHGSETSSSGEFIRSVHPKTALVSVGRDNRFGHPANRIMVRLRQIGIDVLRTDRVGAVTVKTDGNRFWIEQTIH